MDLELAAEGAALLLGPIGFGAISHIYKDRNRPEPVRDLFLVYLPGMAAGYLFPYATATLDWSGLCRERGHE
jgi:hypothetical protein